MVNQYVCKVCGYNIIGSIPHKCPFCGCNRSHFITATECSDLYCLTEKRISKKILMLKTKPKLGLSHAAYAVETLNGEVWVDCPACFENNTRMPKAICFTHHHFMGACNLYQRESCCEVYIQEEELQFSIAKPFLPTITHVMTGNFWAYCELQALRIAGHTPGFTVFFLDDVCFCCDIVLLDNKKGDSLNTFSSSKEEVVEAVKHLIFECDNRGVNLICAYNSTFDYHEWRERTQRLLD
ncbi:MBL fold metallo-hydrolase [Lentisphaerota bacterium WC36G]|nr:MBL fold metallo-hydrolase [Lentisphaerae bacterium WC36]